MQTQTTNPKIKTVRIYDMLSPDGLSITHTGFFASEQEAEEYFSSKWITAYRVQGYYSTARRERIPLASLRERCTITDRGTIKLLYVESVNKFLDEECLVYGVKEDGSPDLMDFNVFDDDVKNEWRDKLSAEDKELLWECCNHPLNIDHPLKNNDGDEDVIDDTQRYIVLDNEGFDSIGQSVTLEEAKKVVSENDGFTYKEV